MTRIASATFNCSMKADRPKAFGIYFLAYLKALLSKINCTNSSANFLRLIPVLTHDAVLSPDIFPVFGLLYISRGTSYVISYHFYLEETWKVAFKLRPEKSHVSVDTVRVDIKKSKKDIRKYMPEAEQ